MISNDGIRSVAFSNVATERPMGRTASRTSARIQEPKKLRMMQARHVSTSVVGAPRIPTLLG